MATATTTKTTKKPTTKKEIEVQLEELSKKRLAVSRQESRLRQQWDSLCDNYMALFKCPVCGNTEKSVGFYFGFDLMFQTFDIYCCNCGLDVKGKTIKELRKNLNKKAREAKKCAGDKSTSKRGKK